MTNQMDQQDVYLRVVSPLNNEENEEINEEREPMNRIFSTIQKGVVFMIVLMLIIAGVITSNYQYPLQHTQIIIGKNVHHRTLLEKNAIYFKKTNKFGAGTTYTKYEYDDEIDLENDPCLESYSNIRLTQKVLNCLWSKSQATTAADAGDEGEDKATWRDDDRFHPLMNNMVSTFQWHF